MPYLDTSQRNSCKTGRIAGWKPEWAKTCLPCWSRGVVGLPGDTRTTTGPFKLVCRRVE